MIAVNLIPTAVRRRQAFRRRLRAWTLVLLPVACVLLLPFVAEARRRSQTRQAGGELERLEGVLHTLRRDVSATAAAVQNTESRIARARALRTKRSWAGLLAAVARCMPDEVWLTSLATEQSAVATPPRKVGAVSDRDPSTTASSEPRGSGSLLGRLHSPPSADPRRDETGGSPPVVVLDAATRLQLTGFALNHERLYDLMSRLKDAGVFTSVELVKAGMEPVGAVSDRDSRAVKFVLACGW